MTEVKNLKIPSGCSAFGWWSFKHDDGSICDINNDDGGLDKSLDSCPVVESYINSKLVAMLTDIQLEIKEKSIIDYDEDLYDGGECVISISEINEIIQDKINSLKEGT